MVVRSILANFCWVLFVVSCQSSNFAPPRQEKESGNSKDKFASGLIPSHSEEHTKREATLAEGLGRTINEMPGIESARVHISLKDESILSSDKKTPSKAVVVVHKEGMEVPLDEAIKNLVSSSVRGITKEEVRIIAFSKTKGSNKTEFVGPIEVADSSAFKAKLIIGGLIVLSLLMAFGLIFAGIKIRQYKS